MKCPSCKNGKNIVTAKLYTANGWQEMEPVVMDCFWCGGTGVMTDEQKRKKDLFDSAWCKCGNPSGESNYYHYPDGTHGYACADCGKITQTG